MITIKFMNERKPLKVDAENVKEAVEKLIKNGVSLYDVNLNNADLRDADFSETDFTRAYFRNADLKNVKFTKATLMYTNFWGANLTGADFRKANLHGSVLGGTILHEADFFGAYLNGADFLKANIDYSCWPLWCGSIDVKIDKRIFCQLLYHVLTIGKSIDDPEVQNIFEIPKVIKLANQFHRAHDCRKIKN